MSSFQKKHKRIIGIKSLFIACLIILSFCVVINNHQIEVKGDSHTHCLCGDENCDDHYVYTFNPITSLPTTAGAYYLTDDITFSDTFYPKHGTYICLNGHALIYTGTGNAIVVNNGVRFSITDCERNKAHYFQYHKNNYWILANETDNCISVDTLKSLPNENQIISVSGGILTNTNESNNNAFLYINTNTNVFLYGGSFVGNHSNSKGGAVSSAGNLTIDGANFYGNFVSNDSTKSGYGGAVYATYTGSLNFKSGNFKFNYANHDGGAICVACPFTMSGGTISYNQAKEAGGVFAVVESQKSSATFIGGEITYNRCENNCGGGVYVQIKTYLGGSIKIINNSTINGTRNNYFFKDGTLTTNANETFTKEASIGITTWSTPGQFRDLAISNECTNDLTSHLFSDNTAYRITAKLQNSGAYQHYLIAHYHDYTFERVNDSIVGTCSDSDGLPCKAHQISISFDIEPITYYPETVEVSVNNETEFCSQIEGWVVVRYKGTGSTNYASTYTMPTEVGTYVASISYGGVTIEKSFEIKEPHRCNNLTYSKLLKTTSGIIAEGNYFLTSDVTLTGSLIIENNTNVNICLNGHVLNLNGYNILNRGDLQIYSCQEVAHKITCDKNGLAHLSSNGEITITKGIICGGNASNGGAIMNACSLTCKNIAIIGNAVSDNGSAIYNAGVCTLKDCDICYNYSTSKNLASAVNNIASATISIYGSTEIAKNYYSGKISNLFVNPNQTINIVEKQSGFSIGVTTSQPQLIANYNGNIDNNNIVSDIDKYVAKSENNAIRLVDFQLTQQPSIENGFTVLTNANNVPNYKWYYVASESKHEFINNVTNCLSNVFKAGQYYCVVYNGDFSIQSNLVNAYQINFKAEQNDNDNVGTMFVLENTNSKLLANFAIIPKKIGYKFNNWQCAINNQLCGLNAEFIINTNLDVFATWVEKENINIHFETMNVVYNGQPASYNNKIEGLEFEISYLQNGKTVVPTNAGSYDVVIKRGEDDTYKEYYYVLENGLIIDKAICEEPKVISRNCYNGQEQFVELSGVESYMSTDCNFSAIEIGTYEIIFTLDENHVWADGQDGVIAWEIRNPEIQVYAEGSDQVIARIEFLNGKYVECFVDVEIFENEIAKNETSMVDYQTLEGLEKNEEVTYIVSLKLYQIIDGKKVEIDLNQLTNNEKVKLSLWIPETFDVDRITKIIHVHSKDDITIYNFDLNNMVEGYYEIEIDRFSQFAIVTLKKDYTFYVILGIGLLAIATTAILLAKKKKRV